MRAGWLGSYPHPEARGRNLCAFSAWEWVHMGVHIPGARTRIWRCLELLHLGHRNRCELVSHARLSVAGRP